MLLPGVVRRIENNGLCGVVSTFGRGGTQAEQCIIKSSTRLNAVSSPGVEAIAAALSSSRGRGIISGVGAASASSANYFLIRVLFLRGLAFIYTIAFLVAYHQNRALIGDDSITPARRILNNAEERGKVKRQRRQLWLDERKVIEERKKNRSRRSSSTNPNPIQQKGGGGFWGIVKNTKPFRRFGDALNQSTLYQNLREKLWDRSDRLDRPLITLLWLAKDRRKLNSWLNGIALIGLTLSMLIFSLGSANVPILFLLWLCQRSLMSVGGVWYGYGWEPQLAELTFHALFLVPLWSMNPFPMSTPVPTVVLWAIRWYLFRIMMGAGLIKIKSGDKKWKDLTAMDYFYETQPVPNGLTRYFHFMPKWWHKFEVMTNHFVELVAPWLMLMPLRSARIVGGLIQLSFQMVLILSGNLSFLNWLTMVPAIFCLDDAYLINLFNKVPFLSTSISSPLTASTTTTVVNTTGGGGSIFRQLTNLIFGILICTLSIPVIQNLLAKRQLMNASFDPLRLVNTYGAFGTVNENREELIIKSAYNITGPWKEYEFKVKPGNVMKRPRWISPYHYRLDWQMWIASTCRDVERSPWMYRFLMKLLKKDEDVLGLLQGDPWEDEVGVAAEVVAGTAPTKTGEEGAEDVARQPKGIYVSSPRYIVVDRYRYKFNTDTGRNKPYWVRERVGRFFPRQGVATVDSLAELVKGG